MVAGKHVKEEGLENDLCDMILADPMFMITKEELDAIMQPENFTGRSAQQTEEFVSQCIQPILKENADLLGEHFEMKN
jgi:adenylosuccinate lyase